MSINLSKTPRVNLSKGQSVCLTKEGTETSDKLHQVFFGASWKSIFSIDLDASLICYNDEYTIREIIYFGHKISNNKSIKHSGDDLIGGFTSNADNETISINLDNIDKDVKYIVATLNSYSGESFGKITKVSSRIYSGALGKPKDILCSYDINYHNSPYKSKTNIVLGYFVKENDMWKFYASGNTSNDIRIDAIAKGIALDVIKNRNNEDLFTEHFDEFDNTSNFSSKLKNIINKIFNR